MKPPRYFCLESDGTNIVLRLASGNNISNFGFDKQSDFGSKLLEFDAHLRSFEAAYEKQTSLAPQKPQLQIVSKLPTGLPTPGNGAH
jgi:hypothetical protein